ncbi:MAG: hypothetical protein P4L86_01315, partial [Mycobacterium sp.]|nr:hypothetical protein [Mycobacterium sp.]
MFSGLDAAGATYTPTETDEGGTLAVAVSFTDTHGNAEIGSTTVGTVAEDPNENATVALVGLDSNNNAVEGQQITASVADPDAPTSGITYTWTVGGQVVETGVDAAGASYTPTLSDEGSAISVAVSFTDTHGNSETGTATAGTVQTPVSSGPSEPFIWTSELSDDWSVPGDWNNGVAPSASDQIQINSSVTVTIGPSDSVEIDSSLKLDSGATLTGGPLTLGSSGTLDIAGGPDGSVLGNGTPDATLDGIAVTNYGTINVDLTASGAILALDDGATISGGLMIIGNNVASALDIEVGLSGPGGVNGPGPDATLDDVTVTNNGTIEVDLNASGAILALDDGSTITG